MQIRSQISHSLIVYAYGVKSGTLAARNLLEFDQKLSADIRRRNSSADLRANQDDDKCCQSALQRSFMKIEACPCTTTARLCQEQKVNWGWGNTDEATIDRSSDDRPWYNVGGAPSHHCSSRHGKPPKMHAQQTEKERCIIYVVKERTNVMNELLRMIKQEDEILLEQTEPEKSIRGDAARGLSRATQLQQMHKRQP